MEISCKTMRRSLNKKRLEMFLTMIATLLIGAVMIAGVFYIFFKTNLAGEGAAKSAQSSFWEICLTKSL